MAQEATAKKISTHDIAKAYVDKQLATMRANGLKTEKISAEKYHQMVESVAKAVSS